MISTEIRTVSGIQTEIVSGGSGRPLLYLHGHLGLERHGRFLGLLAERHRVVAPALPGFGRTDWPREIRSVSDLAYFAMDLADDPALEDAVLVGSGFGGWVALDMLVRSGGRFGCAVLADPLGVKFGGHLDRDFADIHALADADAAGVLFHDPRQADRDVSALSDDDLAAIVRAREAFTFFGWKPYMHDPSLRRWLHRVGVPTLVAWGASDGFVGADHGRRLAAGIPGARFEILAECGHFPAIERPEALSTLVTDFAAGHAAAAAA